MLKKTTLPAPRATALLPLALAGCLGDPLSPCASDQQCRDAFGFGHVCGEEGYCEVAEMPERCLPTSLPTGILEDPTTAADAFVLASLFDPVDDINEAQASRLAVIEANARGGIDGRQIALIECSYAGDDPSPGDIDDGLDKVAAMEMLSQFLAGRLGIAGFIGPHTSGQSEAFYNATEDLGPPFTISPSATSPALTYIDGLQHSDADPGTFWRTAAPDSLQGRVAAEDMRSRGREKVAVIYQTGAYGEGFAQIFTEVFTAAGGTVEGFKFNDASEMVSYIVQVSADPSIEEVFMIGSETGLSVTFLNGAAQAGGFVSDPGNPYPATGKGILLADGASDEGLFPNLSADVQPLLDCRPPACGEYQIRGTRPGLQPNTRLTSFKIAYEAQFPGQSSDASGYMPYAYDAGWLAVYATAWSHFQEGAVTGPGMGAGMRRVSSGTVVDLLPSGWNTARQALESGQSIDVQGTSGPLDYDPITEECETSIEVWTILPDRTGFEVVQTVEPD